MVIDRLCANVEPAMKEAIDPPAAGGAFERVQQQLEPLTSQPIGIGLDVPVWLERLEDEVDQVRQESASGDHATQRGLAAGVSLSFAELERQLTEWEKPL